MKNNYIQPQEDQGISRGHLTGGMSPTELGHQHHGVLRDAQRQSAFNCVQRKQMTSLWTVIYVYNITVI